MTETGLLIAQAAVLLLLFGFMAALVRSSGRQLSRATPPPAPLEILTNPEDPARPPGPEELGGVGAQEALGAGQEDAGGGHVSTVRTGSCGPMTVRGRSSVCRSSGQGPSTWC